VALTVAASAETLPDFPSARKVKPPSFEFSFRFSLK
jgi:hypothetical protein